MNLQIAFIQRRRGIPDGLVNCRAERPLSIQVDVEPFYKWGWLWYFSTVDRARAGKSLLLPALLKSFHHTDFHFRPNHYRSIQRRATYVYQPTDPTLPHVIPTVSANVLFWLQKCQNDRLFFASKLFKVIYNFFFKRY